MINIFNDKLLVNHMSFSPISITITYYENRYYLNNFAY